MRHRHHLVHVTYLAPHSTLPSVPLCVRPTLGSGPLLLRTSALISPTAAAVVCGRGQKMVLSRMLSTLESILDVVRQLWPFLWIIFAMFPRTPQQQRVNNIWMCFRCEDVGWGCPPWQTSQDRGLHEAAIQDLREPQVGSLRLPRPWRLDLQIRGLPGTSIYSDHIRYQNVKLQPWHKNQSVIDWYSWFSYRT